MARVVREVVAYWWREIEFRVDALDWWDGI